MPRKQKKRLPANFQWRDGRPRWEPGPTIRAKGHKGCNLKDANDAWLAYGAAIEAAQALNAAITTGTPAPRREPGARSVSALIAAFRARGKMGGTEGGKRKTLADKTRRSYNAHLDMLNAGAGDLPAAAIRPADAETLYDALVEQRGPATANAVMRTAKQLFFYAGEKGLRWFTSNPFVGLQLQRLSGRLVLWEDDEITAAIAAADWLGCHSIADAITIGLFTGQREGDVITMPPLQETHGIFRVVQSKTGHTAYLPALAPLQTRIAAMNARQAACWPNVHFPSQIVAEMGRPYNREGTHFRHEFAKVRAIASGAIFAIDNIFRWFADMPPIHHNLPFTPQPEILGKHFSDLRDTAVTWLFDASCDVAEIATITGHSLTTVNTILDKHYFVRHAAAALRAGAKLNKLLALKNLGG